MAKYTPEQYWKLYQKLPQELKDALFAKETENNIYEICKRNEVEESLAQIVEYVGQVLLGVLPPEDFQKILEKELKLKKEKAKKINREIFRFIFFPVKTSLEKLYKIEIVPPVKPGIIPSPKAKPPTRPKRDIYREPIE